jgi:hypothetical protein
MTTIASAAPPRGIRAFRADGRPGERRRPQRLACVTVTADIAPGTAAFANADRLSVMACCDTAGARFPRESMPTPRTKDQR